MTLLEHYTVLQVPRDCSGEEVRRAYHRLARLHHPDKQQNGASIAANGLVDAENDAAFRRVQHAYEVLRDPATRAAYDRELVQNELLQKRDVDDVRIADEVAVTDMQREELDDGDVLYAHTCRCGDVYEVIEEELQDGIDVIPCNGCSLNIRVLLRP